jgi:molecular chaperone GrpE
VAQDTKADALEDVSFEAPEESLEDLKLRLEEARKTADERLDQLLRARAEAENAMKIACRAKEEYARYASEKLVAKLLCIVDSMEQAAKHDEGAKALYQQLMDVLKTEGLEPIESLGKKFDPYRHEALYSVPCKGDEEDDTVAKEISKGYTLNSKVIRFAKVAVAKR